MSTNLYWRPKQTKNNKAGKDCGLKWALQKRFGYPVSRVFTNSIIDYLKGLADANVDGAQDLIDAIEKYGSIEVFEE